MQGGNPIQSNPKVQSNRSNIRLDIEISAIDTFLNNPTDIDNREFYRFFPMFERFTGSEINGCILDVLELYGIE